MFDQTKQRNKRQVVFKKQVQGHVGRAVGAIQVLPAPLPLYEFSKSEDDQVAYVAPGLEPVLRTVLQRQGYQVQEGGRAPVPWSEPAWDRLDKLPAIDQVLLETVRNQLQSLICIGQSVDAVQLVAEVALAWPGKTMAVLARTIRETRQTRDKLQSLGVDAVAINSRNLPDRIGQVAVCTPIGLADTDFTWLDCVFVMDATLANSKRCLESLGHIWRARLYGLLPIDAKLAPLEQDLISALFGLVEITIPRHGHCERQVQVVTFSIQGGPVLALDLDLVALKRQGLWRHPVRNRLLTKIARALQERDSRAIEHLLHRAVHLTDDQRGVLVLVENVEHALVLAERLAGWQVITGPDVNTHGLNAEQVQRLQQCVDPFTTGPLFAIVTAAALPEVDLREVGILLRADGGIGLPLLTREQLTVPDGQPVPPLLLVDLVDHQHPLLRRQSRQRQEQYEKRSWFAPGIDPVQGRVERFLASRPGQKGGRR
jgi:hypothetical protein